MRKLIFKLAVLAVFCGFVMPAQAICIDKVTKKEYPALAYADASGVAVVELPDGSKLRFTKLEPGRDICKVHPFPPIHQKCPDGVYRDDKRHAGYCKGVGLGGQCWHMACPQPAKTKRGGL